MSTRKSLGTGCILVPWGKGIIWHGHASCTATLSQGEPSVLQGQRGKVVSHMVSYQGCAICAGGNLSSVRSSLSLSGGKWPKTRWKAAEKSPTQLHWFHFPTVVPALKPQDAKIVPPTRLALKCCCWRRHFHSWNNVKFGKKTNKQTTVLNLSGNLGKGSCKEHNALLCRSKHFILMSMSKKKYFIEIQRFIQQFLPSKQLSGAPLLPFHTKKPHQTNQPTNKKHQNKYHPNKI